MNPESLRRDLGEMFDDGVPVVTIEEVEQKVLRQARRAPQIQPVWLAVGGFATVIIAGLAIGLLTQPIEPVPLTIPPATPTSPASTRPPTATTTASPESSTAFVPPTRSVDGTTYLTLTLLDGSHIKLAYPSDLDLTSSGVGSATVGSLDGAHGRDIEVHYGSPDSLVAMLEEYSGPGELAATYPGFGGGVVERWEFPEMPLAYLVYDFHPWTVYVWDGMGGANAPMGEEAERKWAASLWGEIYDPGFLVLRSEPPLHLVPASDDPGPSGPDIRVDGKSGSLLISINDCDRLGETLDDETYGKEIFAFCDEGTDTLLLVGGDAQVQERIHNELIVNPVARGLKADSPPLDQPTGGRVYFSTDTQLTVVDVDARSVVVHDLPALAPGDPPYRLAWRGERLVLYGQTDLGRAVIALDPADPLSPIVVKEGAFFLPSANPDRVWAFESNSQGVTTMQELTVHGEATTSEVPTPTGLWPAGAVDRGVLFHGYHGLELWGPDGQGPIQDTPGPYLVAAWRDLLLTCGSCDQLDLVYLDQGTRQDVDIPIGVVQVSGNDGVFSPDGRYAAVLGFLTPPPITADTEMAVILIDIEAATASIINGSLTTNRFSFPRLAWDSEGEWLFIGPVLDDETDEGRLLAYRPGDETAYQVLVFIGADYHGMAAE